MLYNESKHNILASVGKANKKGIILYNESKHNILALVGKANKNGINTGSKDPTSLVDKYDPRQYQSFMFIPA
jgi:hypothetical protein